MDIFSDDDDFVTILLSLALKIILKIGGRYTKLRKKYVYLMVVPFLSHRCPFFFRHRV